MEINAEFFKNYLYSITVFINILNWLLFYIFPFNFSLSFSPFASFMFLKYFYLVFYISLSFNNFCASTNIFLLIDKATFLIFIFNV